MKKVLLIFLVLFLLSCFAVAEKVILGTGEWAPFTSESLPNYGFASELAKAAFAEEGIDVEFKFFPWKRCESELQAGNLMAIFPYAETEERLKIYSYAKPLFKSKTLFFYLKTGREFKYDTLDDLKPYRIGGVLGYYYKDAFDKAGIDVDYSPKEINALRKLLAGRIDLYPGTEITTWELIKNELPGDIEKFGTLPKPHVNLGNGLMFSNKNPNAEKYIKIFNKGLEKIKANGKYEEILKKHKIQMEVDF